MKTPHPGKTSWKNKVKKIIRTYLKIKRAQAKTEEKAGFTHQEMSVLSPFSTLYRQAQQF
jgi:hypothetical protein